MTTYVQKLTNFSGSAGSPTGVTLTGVGTQSAAWTFGAGSSGNTMLQCWIMSFKQNVATGPNLSLNNVKLNNVQLG